MGVGTWIAIYFLIWWLTLFAVLPWGVRPQGGDGAPGTDPGAPQTARVLMKLVWTTGVAAVIWAIGYVAYTRGYVTLDGMASVFGIPANMR